MTENHTVDFVNDDTVFCNIYSTTFEENDITFWINLCEMINETISNLAAGYIWHRDKFRVHIPVNDGVDKDLPQHLTSTTCFGDSIEDEWFIVYLLREITGKFKDIIVQIKDNDGDFLLIEAADYLPPWANPDSTENRVFIYNNEFHFITKKSYSELSIKEAIKIVRDQPESSKVSTEINASILNRIGGYPEKIKDNLHNAIVKLPIDIATLLTLDPSLISPIVATYCNHDMIDAKSCKNVNYTDKDCISTKVIFTKCQYAMLTHSKLLNSKSSTIIENDKKSLLGFKLTCGYQMITNKLGNNMFTSKEYQKFLNNLKANGYFQENIEGSKNYMKLLEQAKAYFMHMECSINSHVANNITNLMTTDDFLKLRDTLKNKTEHNLEEDSDSWLTIHPEQLNDLLEKNYGKKDKFQKDDIITPQTITSKLTDFLKQTSDFEGIEKTEDSEAIHFDSEEFVNSLEKMLDIHAFGVDNEDSDSEIDDMDMTQENISTEMQKELVGQIIDNDEENDNVIVKNIVKSVKEEEGASGPSSNLLNTIGINKTDLLDSDDD